MTSANTPVGKQRFCACDECVAAQPWRATGQRPRMSLEAIERWSRRCRLAALKKMQLAREVL